MYVVFLNKLDWFCIGPFLHISQYAFALVLCLSAESLLWDWLVEWASSDQLSTSCCHMGAHHCSCLLAFVLGSFLTTSLRSSLRSQYLRPHHWGVAVQTQSRLRWGSNWLLTASSSMSLPTKLCHPHQRIQPLLPTKGMTRMRQSFSRTVCSRFGQEAPLCSECWQEMLGITKRRRSISHTDW